MNQIVSGKARRYPDHIRGEFSHPQLAPNGTHFGLIVAGTLPCAVRKYCQFHCYGTWKVPTTLQTVWHLASARRFTIPNVSAIGREPSGVVTILTIHSTSCAVTLLK